MLHRQADGAIFVTLGFFSKPAQDYGKQQGIMLINGSDLVRMTG
jgi:restriction endonuclease Mrr